MKIESAYYKEDYVHINSGKAKSKEIKDLDKLIGLEINSFEDLKDINDLEVQLAILDSIKQPWKFLDSKAKTLPRPLSVVFKSEKGFKEYLILSLDSKSILKSLWANEKIAKAMSSFKAETEIDILDKLSKEIDNVQRYLDFKIRIGINVNHNLELMSGEKLDTEEMFKFLLELVNSYNICYLENPFENKLFNAKLMEAVKHMCLVTNNSFNGSLNNAYLLKTKNLIELKKEIDELKNLKITQIMDYENNLSIDLCVGFNVFILKHDIFTNINDQMQRIYDEIKQG